jgi:multiple sugar transport system permease protein/raffinose/stachyose/melibiose transport system permease protein
MNQAQTRRKIGTTVLLAVLLAYTFITFAPFLWTATMSFRTTNDILDNPYGISWPPYLKNYVYAFTKFGFLRYVGNSVFVTVCALVITTIVTSMAAFGFARQRYQFGLRELIYYLIFISIMFPPQISLLALFQILVRYNLYNTLWGLILVYSASALPFNIFLLRAFFAQIPQDIEDASRIDGCSDWQMFWRVMFPIARPAVATTIVLNFINFWNEFLYAVTFVTKQEARTLPLAVMFFLGEAYLDLGMLASGLMVSVLPVIILYLILSEQFIKGMTAGAIKG